jgi:non-specific serine/threonine protein kinase
MSLFSELLNEYFSPEIKKRGLVYFEDDHVTNVRLDKNIIIASVQGNQVYDVRMAFDKDLRPTTLLCSCPYADHDYCKHLAATLYKINSFGFFTAKYYREQIQTALSSSNVDLNSVEVIQVKENTELNLSAAVQETENEIKAKRLKLYFEEMERLREEERFNGLKASLALLTEKTEKSNYTAALQKISYGIDVNSYMTNFSVMRERLRKDGSSDGRRTVIYKINNEHIDHLPLEEQLIIQLIINSGEYIINPHNYDLTTQRKSSNETHILNKVLEFLHDKEVYFGQNSREYNKRLHVFKEFATPVLIVEKEEENISLSLEFQFLENKHIPISETHPVLDKPLWIMHKDEIFRVNQLNFAQYQIFYSKKEKIIIPNHYEEYFEANILTKISSVLPISSQTYKLDIFEAVPSKHIYLEEEDGVLTCRLKFLYGEFEISYAINEHFYSVLKDKSIIQIRRDLTFEEMSVNEIEMFDVKFYPDGLFIPKKDPVDFLFEAIPQLKEKGFEIFGVENLRQFSVNLTKPLLNYSVSSGVDWFDLKLEVSFGDFIVPLENLLKAVRSKKKYIKLGDGALGLLPEEWIQRFAKQFSLGDVRDENIRLSKLHYEIVEEIVESNESISTDTSFNDYLKKLELFKKIKSHSVPKLFHGKLRPYQKSGFDWLLFLKEFGFGGILADDMGLGKTIQVLALLASLKKNKEIRPNLIIAPTSVVFNWINEINKFTPSLKVLNHTGIEREKESLNHFNDYDIVLTSYPVMLRDIEQMNKIEFNYIILDESQKIKNPFSLTAKAAFSLTGKSRLCLTGTPIENNLLELWSQMNFLNPGFLGSINKFNDNFKIPIDKEKSEESTEYLRKIILPFILRRTKEVVATELPEKSEIIHYCEMTKDQKDIYDLWRESIRAELLEEINEKGLQKSSFKVIEGLLRLRQICNHPVLVKNGYKKESGKMEEFKELILRVTEEGHKVLVFSQFVQMLDILKAHLLNEKISFEYLTGSTKNREERVDNFQNNPEIKVFLISLKAGGVGINLTAADYVFHIDPWWNPAVEMQATDRSHRIGQDKKVFVYKFITKETVEEKILNLQAKKKKMVENILTTETGVFKNLTKDDIELLLS